MKSQPAINTDVSLYVIHAVENNVSSRYVNTVWSLGLHTSAFDEDALLQDDVFLSEITNIRDCQT